MNQVTRYLCHFFISAPELHVMHTFSRRICLLLDEELFTRDSQHNLFKLSWNISIRKFKVSDLWINSQVYSICKFPLGNKGICWRWDLESIPRHSQVQKKKINYICPQMSVARKMELHRETVITLILLHSRRKKEEEKKEDLIWRHKKV